MTISAFSGLRRLVAGALLLSLGAVFMPASAQDTRGDAREIVLSRDTDFFGGDYETKKGISLDDCSRACVADSRCAAFTYNEKARWCFLKEKLGEAQSFAGATGGRIVVRQAVGEDEKAARLARLDFLPRRFVDDARRFAGAVGDRPLKSESVGDLVDAADAAREAKDIPGISDNYQDALRKRPEDGAMWGRFSRALLSANSDDWQMRRRATEEATNAAVLAVLNASDDATTGEGLALLGVALERNANWKPAIRAYRASLKAREMSWVSEALAKIEAQRGFRVVEHTVDSDAVNPRACVVFSDPIAASRIRAGDYVQVEGRGDIATEAEDRQICVDGVRHGERYRITVRSGLPASDGEVLKRNVDLDIYVRDRAPSVRFPGRAYVLPAGGEASIPVVTVNTDLVNVEVLRIGDRGLARTVGDDDFLGQLSGYDVSDIRDSKGQSIWKGAVEVRRELNRDMTTAIPVAEFTRELKPGVYVMIAKAANEQRDEYWEPSATQWFIVTDIGLTTLAGPQGLEVFARSLSGAAPVAGARVRLVAANDEILGNAVTDAQGRATLDPGLLAGEGGNAPALVVAETDGDYAFLDFTAAPFDLTDRGVTGRPAPKALDLYAVSDRGVYRPGEDVELTALVRNAKAEAVSGTPLTLILTRPDGVEHSRAVVADSGLGGHHATVTLSASAMRGQWRAGFHTDPEAEPLVEVRFLVEDFQPERLDFDLASDSEIIDIDSPGAVSLKARFLYGAPAADLAIEGETKLSSTQRIPAFPGYLFGLEDEAFEPLIEPVESGITTGEDGSAELSVNMPEVPPSSLPMEAEIHIRVLDPGGRPVERTLKRPVASGGARLGIKPLFDGSVEQGGNARFELIAVDQSGGRVAAPKVRWELSERETRFQWYQADGQWNYEPVVTTKRVASGDVDVAADGQAIIEAPVGWGGYELSVHADGALPASTAFDAGWYVSARAEDTPDVMKVALDKQRYAVGETAKVRLTPRFAGTALVMVVDDRLISMTTIEVPEDGAEVSLPVTAEWGPGAYVTAMLYRPMDIAAKRMPGRAIGLQWASVDPAERKLGLAIDAPDTVRPRGAVPVKLTIAGLPAGETAYLTLAAVDVGILNLTEHPVPDPDGYYFGQRRLGVGIRDLYGRLIDRMQGAPGTVRSGGDGGLARFDTPPPSDDLVAFHSGVVTAGPDGSVTVDVDLPDFNGTVRLAAMAWTAAGVGHASREMVVRDPVVVLASAPHFLQPGDRSRIALDLAHADGPAGLVRVSVEGDGIDIPSDADKAVELAAGERRQLIVPLVAGDVGDHSVTVHLTTPDGTELAKTIRLPVRANEPPVARIVEADIAPAGSLTLDEGLLDGMIAGTAKLAVSVGGQGDIDVPGLVAMLDRYPYGCTEQLTSRAMPLVYLDDVARVAGLEGDDEAVERVSKAIPLILANQSSNGGFTLWGSGDANDLWLDSYVTEFLTRAREKGFAVPDTAFRLALDNLRNRLAYAPEFESGGEDIAYALYVLARNGRAAIGDLRYYAEAKLDAFATPMAKAQLGAALALYGDRQRAATTLAAAWRSIRQDDDPSSWRSDYGSKLRDGAAVLTLAAESGVEAVDIGALGAEVGRAFDARKHTSTQEQVWLTLAANALQKRAAPIRLEVNGQAVEGRYAATLDGVDIAAAPLAVANLSERPAAARVTITGVPATPEPAGGEGYAIERAYFDLDGNPVVPTDIALGTRLVAVLTVTTTQSRSARLIVNDPLPAGFEIDNPSLIRGGEVPALEELDLVEETARTEFRSDRFVAAIDRSGGDATEFQLAYVVRAVSPGSFAHPAAQVEDMYRPEFRARTASGRVEIVGPLR